MLVIPMFFLIKNGLFQDCSGESKTSMITCELMGGLGNQLIPAKDIMISGYFQSYKYFKDNHSSIYDVIRIENMKLTLLQKLICQMKI